MRYMLAVLLLSLSLSAQTAAPKPTTPVGRYQLILYQGEMPRFNTHLLNTETGKVWTMVTAPDETKF